MRLNVASRSHSPRDAHTPTSDDSRRDPWLPLSLPTSSTTGDRLSPFATRQSRDTSVAATGHQNRRSSSTSRTVREPATPSAPANRESIADELHLRDVTRDSMVDNLLSSFDFIAEGSATYQPSLLESRSRQAAHRRIVSDTSTNSADSFDPYKYRSTPIRRPPDSHQASFTMPGVSRTPERLAKKQSKGSKTSIDFVDIKKAGDLTPRPAADLPAKVSRPLRANPDSIIDRARPLPSEYYDFDHFDRNGQAVISGPEKPTIFARSDNQDAFKVQVSTRNKVATLTGSEAVIASSPGVSRSTKDVSRQASIATFDENRTSSTDAHAEPDNAKGSRQGFFRRVFGTSSSAKTIPSRPSTPVYQLPPLTSGPTGLVWSSTPPKLQGGPDSTLMRPVPPRQSSKQQTQREVNLSAFVEPTPPPAPITKEPPSTVTKKPSFFRRRKKSIEQTRDSGLPPDPGPEQLPSTQSLSQSASSLLLAMDSVLNLENTTTNGTDTFYDTKEHQDDGRTQRVLADTRPFRSQKQADAAIKEPSRILSQKDPVESSAGPIGAKDYPAIPVRRPSDRSLFATSSIRSASTVAQLTGRFAVPDEAEDDWVAATPFKRPGAPSPQAQPRLWIDASPEQSVSDTALPKDAPSPALLHASSASRLSNRERLTASSSRSTSATDVHTADAAMAKKIFDEHDDLAVKAKATTVLGQQGKEELRRAYLDLFDFGGINILTGLRDLCGRLALKGETQQVDRIIVAFAERWCACNPWHGFKSKEVETKMSKQQFVKNTMGSIVEHVGVGQPSAGQASWNDSRPPTPPTGSGRILSAIMSPDLTNLLSPGPGEGRPTDTADLLVANGSNLAAKTWENQAVSVLKEFYVSIRNQRLPLRMVEEAALAGPSLNLLRRAGSVVSKSGSEYRAPPTTWTNRKQNRGKIYHSSTYGSSATSLDDGSVFSPAASSTWSRSLSKQNTGMSSDSLPSAFSHADYGFAPSVGFASALSNAIIREEEGPLEEDGTSHLLEDESFELEGAPWAKEGMVHHKHHLEAADKKAKDRTWGQCFAVVDRGRLRLFSFATKTAGRSRRNKNIKGLAVGGGNWMDNAEELGSFTLRQTLANELPPPGYSLKRPHVFALIFPTGALHLFQVGTPEIAQEFISTINYWSARLSKEPLVGGVSNVEYGWSDNVVNTALISERANARPTSAAGMPLRHIHSPSMSSARPSMQSSMRGGSIDIARSVSSMGSRLPGDRAVINEWTPPQHSAARSELGESQQLEALRRYIAELEDDLRHHNDLRSCLSLAYSSRHSNAAKAMQNWERKSSYLLREIVKFRTYIDTLEAATRARENITKQRADYKERGAAALAASAAA